ncbi:hypothetical protein SAMN05216414_105143 [Nitrosovibrio sp. Nv17]|nr:hypothetical protein SAMN05216414_105143 [Nitrosovibrio sp. Nv17]
MMGCYAPPILPYYPYCSCCSRRVEGCRAKARREGRSCQNPDRRVIRRIVQVPLTEERQIDDKSVYEPSGEGELISYFRYAFTSLKRSMSVMECVGEG